MIWRKAARIFAIAGMAVFLFSGVFYLYGFRINATKSIPVGLYRVTDVLPEKRDFVLFCPPDTGLFQEAKARGYIGAGHCSGNLGLMMKRLVAVSGDEVVIGDEGVFVNNRLLAYSEPLKADAGGRPLSRFSRSRFVVSDADVLLMSDISKTSFDGRYFGPVGQSQIQAVILPVLVW